MSTLVPHDQIEAIVGAPRHETEHYARAVSAEQTVYILHSRACLGLRFDLRTCAYSRALDKGIEVDRWTEDVALTVAIEDGRLIPSGQAHG